MNTTTQQQMTTGRPAFSASLFAPVQLDSLKQSWSAAASYLQQADENLCHFHVQAGFRGHRDQRTYHIRGGNP